MFPVSDVIPSRTTPFVTIALIAANTLAFGYELWLDGPGRYALTHTLGLVPAAFSWPSLVTSAFLHDGWIHFGGNMLYLWIFGDNVEDTLGHWPFLLFYLAAAATGGLGHAGLNPDSAIPLIGASGAVAGVMGAYFVLYPRSQILTAVFLVLYLDVIEVPAIFFLGLWLLLQIASGLASLGVDATGGVAFAAHVAGFLAGAVVGAIMRGRGRWD